MAGGGDALIEARSLSVRFGPVAVVDKVDMSVHRGEIITVIGPNGAGKSTLVRALLGLLEPSTGAVRRGGDVRIGYVPQHVEIDRTLPLKVGRFLALGTPSATTDEMIAALAEVGAPHLLDTPVQALSGGEMKRVLLARALLRAPDLLVLDEPTAGVDVGGQADLYGLVRRIRDRHRCGILLVSHNLHLVMAATDQVVCLNHHICCQGRPEAVTRDPAFLDLFGTGVAAEIAVYAHSHDHSHDVSGALVPAGGEGEDGNGTPGGGDG